MTKSLMCSSGLRAMLAALALVAAPAVAAADIIHVDIAVIGGKQTGTTWEHAFLTLQDALAVAGAGDQIWVAEGTYEPDLGGVQIPGDRVATFQLINGVAIYGGFQGDEMLLEERDIDAHEIVLSGDLNGDDGPVFANYSENSFHVVTGSGTDSTAVLDGFSISGGHANGVLPAQRRGAGMVNNLGSPTVSSCRFTSNLATEGGGAVRNIGGSPKFVGCGFDCNQASLGGAMSNSGSSQVTLTLSYFYYNVALQDGGALHDAGLSLTAVRTFFVLNEASAAGGGAYCQSNTAMFYAGGFISNTAANGGGMHFLGNSGTLFSALFTYNTATAGEGGALSASTPVSLLNCTVASNDAATLGGGVWATGVSVPFRNCILWDNTDGNGSGSASQIHLSGGATADVTYSLVQGSWPGTGNLSSDPQFEDPLDLGFLLPTSPAIDAGDNSAVPPDTLDVDGNGNTTEPSPLGGGGLGRFLDSVYAPDTGNGTAPIVDLGAYEFVQKMVMVNPAGAQGPWQVFGVYGNLQDALYATTEPSPWDEIWMVAGTYKPDQGAGITPGDRTASFRIPPGVAVYGGFAGDEIVREQRNPAVNITVLSGDLAGNDVLFNPVEPGSIPPSWNENSYHVVSAVDGGTDTLIDGCTITHGRANGVFPDDSGAGLFIFQTNLTARNCLIELNIASVGGGAFTRAVGHPVSFIPRFESCTFRRNAGANSGGGLRNNVGNSIVEDCAFIENNAAQGAGLSIVGDFPDKVAVRRCMFLENLANSGGAVLMDISLDPGTVISDSSFVRNRANINGGALYSYEGDFAVVNCTFFGNTALSGSGAIRPPANLGAGGVDIINCTFSGNTSAQGGVMKAELSSGNGSLLRLTNCTFASNQASGDGGALWCNYGSGPTIRNCVLWNNEDAGGTDGPAQIFVGGGAPTVNYSLVQGGWGGAGGAGIINANPGLVLAPDPGPDGDWDGVDDDYGDLRLASGSPAIDAGDNAAVPADDVADLDGDGITAEPLPLDLGGNPRRVEDLLSDDTGAGTAPIVDLGAYEFTRDCNGNGVSDDLDLANCAGDPACDDCDGNDVPDECDIAGCNPDVDPACDDCNLNGAPDGCDIAVMTSNDGDLDGVPDECAQFVGGCPPGQEVLWSCPQNWILEDVGDDYPDNVQFGGPFNVVLDGSDDVVLDVVAQIDTLLLQESAVLRIPGPGGPGPAPPADLTVVGAAGIDCSGTILMGSEASLDAAAGKVTIAAGGSYGRDPQASEPVSAAMSASSIEILEGPPGAAGTVDLGGGMSAAIGGNAVLFGGDDDCSPPILRSGDSSAMAVGGDLVIDGAADVVYNSSEPMVLGGDFINLSTQPAIFDWLDGALCIGNCGPGPATQHTFEVAGHDLGPVSAGLGLNFAIGTLEISAGASVTFVDQFDNDQAGQPACSEALYVRELILRSGSSIETLGCGLYYLELVDQGGQIIQSGCSAAQIMPPAEGLFDCADLDGDGIRDDGCTWWTVDTDGACLAEPLVFADMGGAFGACAPDGTSDGSDRFHALNCFSDKNTAGLPGYTCEESPPHAYNVDAGGQFGTCAPDSVCDGHDAFHALNAFSNATICSCPADPVAPAPVVDPGTHSTPQQAAVELRSSAKHLRSGGVVEVDVLLASPLDDLRGYQLHLGVSGGKAGRLELVDVFIREPSVFSGQEGTDSPQGPKGRQGLQGPRPRVAQRQASTALGLPSALGPRPSTQSSAADVSSRRMAQAEAERFRNEADPLHTTGSKPRPPALGSAEAGERRAAGDGRRSSAAQPYWSAFNLRTQQMLAGLDAPGIAAPAGSHLATFVYGASAGASGTFVIELLADSEDPAQRTFLFPTPATARIDVRPTWPAIIHVEKPIRSHSPEVR